MEDLILFVEENFFKTVYFTCALLVFCWFLEKKEN